MVGTGSAVDEVGQLVAREGQTDPAGVGTQDLDLLTGAEREVDTGVDRVGGAPASVLDHLVGTVVDVVHVDA